MKRRDDRAPGGDRPSGDDGIGGRTVADEVDEEFAFHVEMSTREFLAAGLSADEAREAALRKFGRMEEARALCTRLGRERDRRLRWKSGLWEFWRDVRLAFRQMARTPVVAAAAVLTLALGIGATTAVFSVVNGVLLSPLPFPDADRIVEIRTRYLPPSGFDIDRFPISVPELVDYRNAATSFESIGIYTTGTRTVTEGGADPERIPTVFLDRLALEVLDVQPVLGRWFTAEEDVPGTSIGLLGHELWTTRFGADSSLIGATVPLAGRAFTVTGVMPPGFAFPDRRYQIFENYGIDPGALGNRAAHGSAGLGRLRDGVDMERVQAEAKTIHAGWEAEYPHNVAHFPIFEDFRDNLIGTDVTRALQVLMASVIVVLLIAAVNVANLLMARGENRRLEFAIRGSLGASRNRIVRQLLTEGLALAALGASLGVFLGHVGVQALLRIDPEALPRPELIELDGGVLLFAALVTIGTATLFGLAPALQAGRVPAVGLISTRSTASRSRWRFRRVLVAAEVGLSLVVVVAAGLIVRSFDELTSVDPGVELEGGLTFPLVLESQSYPDAQAVSAFMVELDERLEALPGVRVASAVSRFPLSGTTSRNDFLIAGRPEPTGTEQMWSAQWTGVSPDYFAAMGIPTLRGRTLEPTDRGNNELVVVVGQGVVEAYFEGQDPVGSRVAISRDSVVWARVVGVVPDTRTNSLDSDVIPQIYYTFAQAEQIAFSQRFLNIAVRTSVPPEGLISSVRTAVRDLDPGLPLSGIKTLEQVKSASVAQTKLIRNLLGLFGLIALGLAMVGIYGVVSYGVSRRTHEIGIRMALGAERAGIARLMLKEGALPALLGIGIALPLALVATASLAGMLYRVSPRDPTVFISVSVGLLLVALLSSWIPARRATRLAPTEALRYE